MYKKTVLLNGLRIVTHDIKNRDSLSIGFWVGVGGRYENDAIKGAAHFLEHIVFKGSQKYTCEEIKEKIEGVGGTLNAFTSEEQTCYYAKIPANNLEQTFDVLSDMVIKPKITSRDVHKEKTVIIEEIKMYHDLPQYFALELLDGLQWPNHPLGKNLAGTIKSVSSLGAKDLKKFHKTHYNPGNIVVSVCGRLNHQTIVNLVKAKFSHLIKAKACDYDKAGNAQSKSKLRCFPKAIEQTHLVLGMFGLDEHHKDRYALSLLSIILGGNMSSRLFVEVREKRGLAYSISSSAKSMHDTGLFLIRAGVDSRKIVEAVRVILRELEKVKRSGVTQGEFNRAKDYLLGQLMLGLEDTMEHMLWLGEAMISKNEMKSARSVIREFSKIKKKDVQRIAKAILNQRHYNLAVVGPLTGQQQKQLNSLMTS